MRICCEPRSGASIAAMQKRHAFSFLFYTLLTITPAYARTAPAAAPANTTTRRQGSAESNVYPMQEGFVDAHGVMIYYKILGSGEPLMIVHGGPGASHDYFLPYLLPLTRHNKVVFIAERGSGLAEKLDERSGYSVESLG